MIRDQSSEFRVQEEDKKVLDVSAAQRRAADPGSSVWVGASAGSGKTKVLADRVTRLLLDGVRPEKILCLTFTRAAAAEMSIRLTQRLSRWAICADSELDKDLDDLLGKPPESSMRDRARRLLASVLSCPGGMRLMTIHAFAQEVLRRFPIEAGLSPTFAVMEEVEAQALWHDAQSDLLQELAQHKDDPAALAFARLVRTMGEGTIGDIVQEVRGQMPRLRLAMEQASGLATLLGRVRTCLELEPDDTAALFCRAAVREGAFDRAGLLHAARVIAEKGTKSFKEPAQAILNWLEKDEDTRAESIDDYAGAFLTDKGKIRKDFANKPLLEKEPVIGETMEAEAHRILRLMERRASCEVADETAATLTLGLRMVQSYETAKTRRAALDFDDLIEKANAVLARSDSAAWVLYKLDGGIDHMLVDEAQDTNPAQWQIVKTLATEFFQGQSARDDVERSLFVVGDEKQSIYSFLKADPRVFDEMRGYFEELIHAAEKPFHRAALTVSFRSAPAVLRAVDAVFAADAVRRGVSQEPVAHQAFRGEGAGRVEVWPLFIPPEEERKSKRQSTPIDWTLPLGYETAHNPSAALAAAIAGQVKRWVAAGETIYDRTLKVERPMTYGDIMVLVGKRGAFVPQLVSALKKIDVAVSGVDRMHLTQQLAVMDLIALLQFTLLPQDDLTLATVLRSPLIGMSEEELMRLAIGRGKKSLWERVREAASFAAVHAYLRDVMMRAEAMTPLALLMSVLSAPCPADAISGRRAMAARLGADAEDPMDELLNVAEAFSARHAPSLQAFLHWLMESEAEIKREMEAAGGRVRITTVHGSKGLEAAVVILPDTADVPSRKRLPKIIWDDEALVPFYVPREPANARLRAIRDRVYDRQMEEHRRLLYVALTRAADRLYVGGFAKDALKEDSPSWYNIVSRSLLPLHQADVVVDGGAVMVPEIVLADYGVQSSERRVQGSIQDSAFSIQEKEMELPLWLFTPPAAEPLPPRPLVPSRPSAMEEEPPTLSPQDGRFARGRIIHRLLQSMPDVDGAQREAVAQKYLANPQHGLAKDVQAEIAAEVLRLIDDPAFAPLFGAGSRAEVPIIGLSGDRLIAGQVDRLALVGGEVWIVDYKTNRPPPSDAANIPRAYRAQMDAYRTVLAAIYPAHPIRCFLLWTHAARLMEL